MTAAATRRAVPGAAVSGARAPGAPVPGAPAPGAPAGLPARGPFPALGNGRVRLRALTPHDLDWLRAAETDEFLAFRWRLRGAHPNPADYLDQLWNGALALFVVERADGPIGIVSAYQADHRNGHCRVAAARLSADEAGDGSFLAGLALFLEYLFTGWPLRKVYLETPEFTLPQFASAVDRGILRVEARLEEFMFLADRYWDVLFLSASRSSWTEFLGTPLARRLLGRPDTAGPADLVTAAPAFTLPVRRP